MYQRSWHQKIASILDKLAAAELLEHQCYFGGGTSLVFQSTLENWNLGGEYRRSDDIDFLCTAQPFHKIRQLVSRYGIACLLTDLRLAREPRIDQYAIRVPIIAPDTQEIVRFEIVCDAASANHAPGAVVNGLTCLSLADSVAHKLMANNDRWADRAVALRHYIDLIAIAHQKQGLPQGGLAIAYAAYGEQGIRETIIKAHGLLSHEGYIERCAATLDLGESMTEFLRVFVTLDPDVAEQELLRDGPLLDGATWPVALW